MVNYLGSAMTQQSSTHKTSEMSLFNDVICHPVSKFIDVTL